MRWFLTLQYSSISEEYRFFQAAVWSLRGSVLPMDPNAAGARCLKTEHFVSGPLFGAAGGTAACATQLSDSATESTTGCSCKTGGCWFTGCIRSTNNRILNGFGLPAGRMNTGRSVMSA